ncbi:MAG: Lar family restriction alleviation protein [Clostridia bacterium]|nr:Lar family restriction alleviation protein [Clostridia bacterium]
MKEKLRRCPFCGGNNISIYNYDGECNHWALYHSCPSGEMMMSVSVYGNSIEDVVKKWNNRAREIDDGEDL